MRPVSSCTPLRTPQVLSLLMVLSRLRASGLPVRLPERSMLLLVSPQVRPTKRSWANAGTLARAMAVPTVSAFRVVCIRAVSLEVSEYRLPEQPGTAAEPRLAPASPRARCPGTARGVWPYSGPASRTSGYRAAGIPARLPAASLSAWYLQKQAMELDITLLRDSLRR